MPTDNGRRAGLVTVLLLSPIFLVFAALGEPENGFVATIACGVIAAAGYANRSSLHKRRVWLILSLVAIAQLIPIAIVQLPDQNLPGILALPFAIIDFLLVLAILAGVQSVSSRRG